MSNNSVFIDTNILIYSNLSLSPFHNQARQKLQYFSNQDIAIWISRQILREYLSAMTRFDDLTKKISIGSLLTYIESFSNYFNVAEDTALVTGRLLKIMAEINVGGKQVHDANIVATMLVYGKLMCI